MRKLTNSSIDDELHTVEEITSKFKVKPAWIYQNIHAGTLPFPYLKVGHHLRFPASGIQDYIQAQTKRAGE